MDEVLVPRKKVPDVENGSPPSLEGHPPSRRGLGPITIVLLVMCIPALLVLILGGESQRFEVQVEYLPLNARDTGISGNAAATTQPENYTLTLHIKNETSLHGKRVMVGEDGYLTVNVDPFSTACENYEGVQTRGFTCRTDLIFHDDLLPLRKDDVDHIHEQQFIYFCKDGRLKFSKNATIPFENCMENTPQAQFTWTSLPDIAEDIANDPNAEQPVEEGCNKGIAGYDCRTPGGLWKFRSIEMGYFESSNLFLCWNATDKSDRRWRIHTRTLHFAKTEAMANLGQSKLDNHCRELDGLGTHAWAGEAREAYPGTYEGFTPIV
ncbi:hypothetical protein P152DRAFT_470364 [Eremomyces bilateralis CBS 781.70]|uniref:Uncharacterized protein n=1 Tax=Eremomyces bilateralis CBS 781.70 TaxID=1392243 RepID=A0A6G1GE45_9PEZI|nr:uncharacterized protein P152DRAFT_470364 [Eremomyces bilateralis CBS 781.70]KAF1816328.1 hypothetical protein P152DRAFT_470364 [Eremomyces bilateralis CBS 781.70]